MPTKSLAAFIRNITMEAFERTSTYKGKRFFFLVPLLLNFNLPFSISSFSFYFTNRVEKILFDVFFLVLIMILTGGYLSLSLNWVAKLVTGALNFSHYLISCWRIMINLCIQKFIKIFLIISRSWNSTLCLNAWKNICLEGVYTFIHAFYLMKIRLILRLA